MPRYFFDLQLQSDEYGIDLPDISAARRYAMRYAGDVIRDTHVDALDLDYWRMDVRQDGETPSFSLVVELTTGPRSAVASTLAAGHRPDGWHAAALGRCAG